MPHTSHSAEILRSGISPGSEYNERSEGHIILMWTNPLPTSSQNGGNLHVLA